MQNNPQDTQKKNLIAVMVLGVLCIVVLGVIIGLIAAVTGATDKDEDGNKTKPVQQVHQTHNEELPEHYTPQNPEEEQSPHSEDGSVMLYRPDGESKKVSPEEAEELLSVEDEDEKWYNEPVVYVYKPCRVGNDEGERKVVKEAELSEYTGATREKDGKTEQIAKEDRWYTFPVVFMYKTGGRIEVVANDEDKVKEFKELGWYTEPVAAITKDGKTDVCFISELAERKAEGWKEYDPQRKPCEYCGSYEHYSKEHPKCSYCGSVKHGSKEHPVCKECGSVEHIVHPETKTDSQTDLPPQIQAKCPVCGSDGHTVHPVIKCSYCGSTEHEIHPSCAKCGSLDHTEDNPPFSCSYCGRHDHRGSEHDDVIARESGER